MFTGIVQAMGRVSAVSALPGLSRITIEAPPVIAEGVGLGASVAVSGVCLTVAAAEGARLTFDVMDESLRLTTLGGLVVGDPINLERSARYGDEVGGHVVSGHVIGMGEIVSVDRPENNAVVTLRVPPAWMRCIFQKGFVALDGASLTVVAPDRAAGTFQVWLIPETLTRTTFGRKRVGDRVNVELDARTQAIVETVEALLPDLLVRATQG